MTVTSSPHSATPSSKQEAELVSLAGASSNKEELEGSNHRVGARYRRHGCSAAWRSLATVQHWPRQKRTAVQDPTWRQRGGQRHFELH